MGFWGGEAEADERAVRVVARLCGRLGPDAVRVPTRRGGRGGRFRGATAGLAAAELGRSAWGGCTASNTYRSRNPHL